MYKDRMTLTEPTFFILTALAGEPRHGYGVIEEVLEMSGGRVRLRAGTLYTALDRLRADGWIEVEREEVVQSRLRRYYRLSALGAQHLAKEVVRQRQNASIAGRRLRSAGFGAA